MWQVIGVLLTPVKQVAFYLLSLHHRSIRPRVAIVCGDEVLLIRNWGDRRWSLPGGGVHRGESSELAAVRECREETGVVIPVSQLKYLATIEQKTYSAPVFVWRVEERPPLHLQKLEITGAQWCSREHTPPLSVEVTRLLSKIEF